MVKKLLGYEIKYYLKIVVFYLPITILMGFLVRIIQFFKTDHFIYDLLLSSSMMLLYVATIVTVCATTVLAEASSISPEINTILSSNSLL